MTRFDRVEPRLPDLLTQLAAPGLPDYTDDVLARTAGIRQRPRWTLLERWLPMGVLAQRSVYIPRIPWRTVIVAALLLVTLAAILAWAGAQRRAAPPFGLARNGLIMYAVDGDIHTWNPDTGETAALITGPTDDFTGIYSRDGTKLAFLRREQAPSDVAPELISIQVANVDGSNPIDLTGPLEAPDQWNWSPSGDAIVLQSKIAGIPTLQIVPTDGSAPPRVIETGMVVTFPDWLPPNGDEIVFRGEARGADGVHSGIYAISRDGGEVRALTPTDGDVDDDYQEPSPSPDGRHVEYQSWDRVANRASLHLLDIASGVDDVVGQTRARYGEGSGMFSPDGKLIAYRGYGESGFQLYVMAADGGAEPRVLGAFISGDAWHEFSPDGTKIIVNQFDMARTLVVDVETGEAETLSGAGADPGTWQRLAP